MITRDVPETKLPNFPTATIDLTSSFDSRAIPSSTFSFFTILSDIRPEINVKLLKWLRYDFRSKF